MASKIKLRRGLAQEWLDANSASPVILSIGEPGFETDTHKLKIGDGTNDWADLPYVNSENLSFTFTDDQIAAIDNGDITIFTNGNTWRFGDDGVLSFPNNNGQIGQLEPPYTGLEFRTGSGADWIGISYGEGVDDNTSYFYFDKEGSSMASHHKANLQVKNPTNNGHAVWTFDAHGGMRFPDDSVQTTAWNTNSTIDYSRITNVPPPVVTPATPPVAMPNINMDGGSAGTVFEAQAVIVYADGGGAGSRFGVNDTIIDGNIGNYIIDGGVGA
jgi:hypothetical protein